MSFRFDFDRQFISVGNPLAFSSFVFEQRPKNTVARIHQRTSKKTQMKSASFTNVDPTTQNNPMPGTREKMSALSGIAFTMPFFDSVICWSRNDLSRLFGIL